MALKIKALSAAIAMLLINSAPTAFADTIYYNSTGVHSSGVWDWQSLGYVIGAGDNNSAELTLKGTSGYDHAFSVGKDGGKGTLTISEFSRNVNDTTYFSVGSVTKENMTLSNTEGVLNLVGADIGEVTTLGLDIGSSGFFDWHTERESTVTGILNIRDGAIMNVGEAENFSNNKAYVGAGNISNTGIINISGVGSALRLINNAPYYGDSVENGTLYLGFIGNGIVNITDGGELSAGRISASTTLANNGPATVAKPPYAEINVTGEKSRLVIGSQMILAADVYDDLQSIDAKLTQKGAGSAVLNVSDYAEVVFEGKANTDIDGFDNPVSGLFMAGNSATSAIVNLNKNGFITIANSSLSSDKDAIIAGDGIYAFNLNGGTLRVNDCSYCEDTLSTEVDMNVLARSTLESGDNKQMLLKGSLAGHGGIVKTGAGLVALAGKNHYLGGTWVEEGELRTDNDDAFVNNTPYTVNGGKLNLNEHDLVMSSLSGKGGVVDVTTANLIIDQNSNSLYAGSFAGAGSVKKQGDATLYLSGDSQQYNGAIVVLSGGLDSSRAVGGNISVHNGGTLSAEGYLGKTQVMNAGVLKVGSLYQNKQTPVSLEIDRGLTNSGSILLAKSGNIKQQQVGNKLLVNGNYSGQNGDIYFNTVLGNDTSATDRMIVTGDTDGTTVVHVNNVGGKGAYTKKGIELINVSGQSQGEFVQKDRIVGGAYEYFLRRGVGTDIGNWYLVSVQPAFEPDPTSPLDPEPVFRPEASEYGANLWAANRLFVHRLHDRLGEPHYVDSLTGEEKVTSMWLRHVGGHTRFRDNSGQLKTQANRYVLQLGGDIAQWSTDERDRFHLGIMGGYANQKSNTRNYRSGYRADGSVHGYSLGAYATWLQNNEEKSGAYIDSWMLYSWFDNSVTGQSLTAERYKSKGATASVEAGYTWKLAEKNKRESYFIQPVAQLTWMGVKADRHREMNGTWVESTGDSNIQSRLGVRAFIKGHSLLDEGKERLFEPFVELNWLHDTKNVGASLNGYHIEQAGTRNIGEIKVGVESQLGKNINLWGNIAQQIGDKAYSDTQAILGVKYLF
ncbi:autotransporter outer membrane beta-barrel domain-containing protein [Mixta intestinalis]|uniref:Outer membrane protein IcsA autotransporter n=1 Tax=Mixta intestinalis TaxID=1615494 RepID=A0A6P1Q147_9GAMM|nr:autotransporter outer membrane beta-barrel domain-containing protein [Mixta intestinalis]QHM72696.1 Outer membrane protein IcsA autotransporter [Mixta intestinalis]